MRVAWIALLVLGSSPAWAQPVSPAGDGRIEGELSYPSDYIPKDMVVCAEEVSSGKLHCNSKKKAGKTVVSYTLDVPAGRYRVYAQTNDMPDVRAYYS